MQNLTRVGELKIKVILDFEQENWIAEIYCEAEPFDCETNKDNLVEGTRWRQPEKSREKRMLAASLCQVPYLHPHATYVRRIQRDIDTYFLQQSSLIRLLRDMRHVLAQPLGSERSAERMCAAVGVRRAQRRPGRAVVKYDQSERADAQSDFGF